MAARASLILDREDSNAHSSEILNNWFKKFQTAFRTSAPLLLASMERDCTQAAPYAVFHDGMGLGAHHYSRSTCSNEMPGENEFHDAASVVLEYNKNIRHAFQL